MKDVDKLKVVRTVLIESKQKKLDDFKEFRKGESIVGKVIAKNIGKKSLFSRIKK